MSLKMPADQWVKCANCKELVYRKEFEKLLRVCPMCNHHQRLRASERIAMVADPGSFREHDATVISADPLGFPEYAEKLDSTRAVTGMNEAVVCGEATLEGYPVQLGVMDHHFRAGSMSAAVGEKVRRVFARGTDKRQAVLLFIASGGARVHEGLHGLMQMAKTSAAIARFQTSGRPYLVVLTDPSMAGVLASYASLGDVILAEPGAVIGFTGPRVMEQTVRVKLPPGHQTAEFQMDHGMVDMVIDRVKLRPTLRSLLRGMVGVLPRKGA
ncbi:MAG: acetyl-CoA carboxylase carboxyl transferase subunit beta [Fimbriimonadaceae bacterium]|nr:acetyl-CoA carboxylase carboxyl transferase subunit beta [Fimbriimonadaceae bacterium]